VELGDGGDLGAQPLAEPGGVLVPRFSRFELRRVAHTAKLTATRAAPRSPTVSPPAGPPRRRASPPPPPARRWSACGRGRSALPGRRGGGRRAPARAAPPASASGRRPTPTPTTGDPCRRACRGTRGARWPWATIRT